MKNYKQLTYQQRYTIEVMLKRKIKKSVIAQAIKVNESTLYRELRRNKRPEGDYRSNHAEILADKRKKEGHYKRKLSDEMIQVINNKLSRQWSPEQIKGYCDLNGIEMVSHERMYQYVWEDKRNGGVLYTHLRNSNKGYKKRYGTKDKRGMIPNRISIEQRPAIVNNKERIGDWEIDLIVGKNHKGAILTAVERKTGFLVMSKTDGKKAKSVKTKTINALAAYKDIVHTITNDNGKEFALHEKVASKLDCQVYFSSNSAHPYASWERGINEYTNKLIRQYLPKSKELNQVKTKEIYQIATKINNRPRKKLSYKTPMEMLNNKFITNLALSG